MQNTNMRTGIFLPFCSRGQGPVQFGEKAFPTIKLGKLEMDRHFEWIKTYTKQG